LASGQPAQVTALFDADCYWRDLVSFTWNIRTQEGHQAIADMLTACLKEVKPSHFALQGEATEADGVVDAWFTFETGVARGLGHLRLKGGKGWTLLTSMTELKGFEEKKGTHRIKGAEHGAHKHRQSWLELRKQEQAAKDARDKAAAATAQAAAAKKIAEQMAQDEQKKKDEAARAKIAAESKRIDDLKKAEAAAATTL
jgi:hypothetical protein